MTKECKQCQTVFCRKPKESYRQFDGRKYCSLACVGLAVSRGNQHAKGYRHTEEAKKKISTAGKGEKHWNWQNAKSSFPRCLECDQRLTARNAIYCRKHCGAHIRGERHPRWVKDRSKLKRSGDAHRDRRSSAYVTWRRQVWKRDGFACRINDSECSGRIEAHHILGYTEHPKLRYEVNNGITLCHFHHPRKRKDEMRLAPLYQELVEKCLF